MGKAASDERYAGWLDAVGRVLSDRPADSSVGLERLLKHLIVPGLKSLVEIGLMSGFIGRLRIESQFHNSSLLGLLSDLSQ